MDITHDAWLLYHKATGLDLFEVPVKNGYIYRVIHNAYFNWLKSSKTMDYKSNRYIYFDSADIIRSIDSPDEVLFGKDLYEYLLVKVKSEGNQNYLDVFDLRVKGFNSSEIAKELNLLPSLVTYYNNKLKKMISNPINGSRVQIKKSIALSQWEKRIDKDDYDLEDENEFYRLYQHKESKEGLLVKLPAAKTNPYIK